MKKVQSYYFIILAFFIAQALFGTGWADSDSSNVSAPEKSSVCSYISGLSDSNYSEAEMFHPCNMETGPYAGSTLTGGYANSKDDMKWLSTHLASHGFIIVAMTPLNIYGQNPQWVQAHKAGINKLKAENSRKDSPVFGKIKLDALQVMGFSKGGGGALLASSELGGVIKSTQALAPFMDGAYNLAGIHSATICYAGSQDIFAIPDNVIQMYNSLPDKINRTLAYFEGPDHHDWYVSGGRFRDRFQTYITAWMKVYLDNEKSFSKQIQGNQKWFRGYSHNQDFKDKK